MIMNCNKEFMEGKLTQTNNNYHKPDYDLL